MDQGAKTRDWISLPVILRLSALSIIWVAILQAFGFTPTLENLVSDSFASVANAKAQVVLLTMGRNRETFKALDLALSLRGLSHLHPRCVLINGYAGREDGPLPLLDGMMKRLQEDPSLPLRVIRPLPPSPTTRFTSVPLIRYGLTSKAISAWPYLEGEAESNKGASFLKAPGKAIDDSVRLEGKSFDGIPLLGRTDHKAIIGSVWWNALPDNSFPILLFGRILMFGNHHAIHLKADGSFGQGSRAEIRTLPLEDFLLRMEQREQGSSSPDFDAIWNRSVVVIGTREDEGSVSVLADLLHGIGIGRLAVTIQGTLALLWTLMVILLTPRISPLIRMTFSLLIISGTVGATSIFINHGVLIPFLPPMLMGFTFLLTGLYKR
jgi:hypothetical protein